MIILKILKDNRVDVIELGNSFYIVPSSDDVKEMFPEAEQMICYGKDNVIAVDVNATYEMFEMSSGSRIAQFKH